MIGFLVAFLVLAGIGFSAVHGTNFIDTVVIVGGLLAVPVAVSELLASPVKRAYERKNKKTVIPVFFTVYGLLCLAAYYTIGPRFDAALWQRHMDHSMHGLLVFPTCMVYAWAFLNIADFVLDRGFRFYEWIDRDNWGSGGGGGSKAPPLAREISEPDADMAFNPARFRPEPEKAPEMPPPVMQITPESVPTSAGQAYRWPDDPNGTVH